MIRDHPNDERIKKIVSKLDADNDGLIAMNEILKLEDVQKDGHGIVVETPSANTSAIDATKKADANAPSAKS